MLRFFRLWKTVAYDANNVFEAVWRTTNAKARVLICNMLAFAATSGRVQKHELQLLQVGSKPYLHGGPTNLALIANTSYEKLDGASNPAPLLAGHFPGSVPLLEGGRRCGVIPVPGGDKVRATIKMMVASSALARIGLECCQIPDQGEDPQWDALWDRLMRDVGNVSFYANKKAYNDALTDERLTAILKDAAARRYTPRGIVVQDATYNFDATEYAAVSARVQASHRNGNPHADIAEPAPLVFAHAGFDNDSKYLCDMERNEESQIDITSPTTDGTSRTWYVLTPFEGREADAPREYGGPIAY